MEIELEQPLDPQKIEDIFVSVVKMRPSKDTAPHPKMGWVPPTGFSVPTVHVLVAVKRA